MLYNYCDEPFSHIPNLNNAKYGDIIFIKEFSGAFYPAYYMGGDITSAIRYRPFPKNNMEKLPENYTQRIMGNKVKSLLLPNESCIALSKDSQEVVSMFKNKTSTGYEKGNNITFLEFKPFISDNSTLRLVTAIVRKIENETTGIITTGSSGWEADEQFLKWVLQKALIVSEKRYNGDLKSQSLLSKIKNFFK